MICFYCSILVIFFKYKTLVIVWPHLFFWRTSCIALAGESSLGAEQQFGKFWNCCLFFLRKQNPCGVWKHPPSTQPLKGLEREVKVSTRRVYITVHTFKEEQFLRGGGGNHVLGVEEEIFNFQLMKQVQGNQSGRDPRAFGITSNVVTDTPWATSSDIDNPINFSFNLTLPWLI